MPRPKRSGRPTRASTRSKLFARQQTPDDTSSVDHGHDEQEESPEDGLDATVASVATRAKSLLNPRQVKELEDLARKRDSAMERLDAEDGPTSASNAMDDSTDKSDSSIEVGRREIATPQFQRDATGLDLDDSVFGDIDASLDDAELTRQGYRSADTSSFSTSQFKRRSRQPSFVGNEGLIRPSSRGMNTPGVSSTFNIGTFKRRARQPSILGTAQNDKSQRTIDASSTLGGNNQEDADDEEEFAPLAESTPLNRRKPQPAGSSASRHAPAQVSSGTRSRKRKSTEPHEDSDRPEKSMRVQSDAAQSEEDSDSELSSLPSPLAPQPPQQARPVTPINHDDIMAPPESSESEDGGSIWPDIRTLAKRRRRLSHATPLPDGPPSDVSSPPSLTHSPNYKAPRTAPKTRGRKREQSPKIMTADLTSLLPRRRHKKIRDDAFDSGSSGDEVDTSGLAQDEDELSYLDARATRLKRNRPLSRAASTNRPASRGGRGVRGASKTRTTPASVAKSFSKTYGDRRASDKENQENDDDADDSFAPLRDDNFDTGMTDDWGAKMGDELVQAVKKFKEVDKWELEYEEVTADSSPKDAR
jgi:ATP-dependent RNA helicase MRH4, mitochondrial